MQVLRIHIGLGNKYLPLGYVFHLTVKRKKALASFDLRLSLSLKIFTSLTSFTGQTSAYPGRLSSISLSYRKQSWNRSGSDNRQQQAVDSHCWK